ncbi:MAG: phosphotransferase [Thermomicrobiales bacterium]
MKPFEDLTTRGKARRLRPLAMSALERYDLDIKRIELVRNDLNGIFRVRTTSGMSYLLRICLPDHHGLATIRSEIFWLEALAREADIPVPEPIPTRDGEMVVTARAEGVPESRRCVLFSWLPGKDLHRTATTGEFEALGRLMARLHDHTDRWQPPDGFRVRTLNQVYPFGDPAGLLGEDHRENFDPDTAALIGEIERRIRDELDRMYGSGAPLVIHADLHWGNVKIYRGTLQPLDFEDLALAFPVPGHRHLALL